MTLRNGIMENEETQRTELWVQNLLALKPKESIINSEVRARKERIRTEGPGMLKVTIVKNIWTT